MKNIIAALLIVSASVLFLLMFTFMSPQKEKPVKDWVYKENDPSDPLNRVPILLYHNIDGKGPFSITLEKLRSHFQFFKDNGIRVVPLKGFVDSLGKRDVFEKKTIVITFDDGYASMYSKLLPLVKEFGYPVTLFVYVDAVGSGRGEKTMNWEKLREMDVSGIDIQAHSISHRDMSSLKSMENENFLYDELYNSKRIMELRLRKKIDFFAFPFGRYNIELLSMASRAGYARVFSTDYGSNIISRDNFCLRRQHIKSEYTLKKIEEFIK